MDSIELFPPNQEEVGVFRGFQHGGLEFHANLLLPYSRKYQQKPMHGQFLLVKLDTPEEAVLGRIASFYSEGKFSSPSGDDFNLRAIKEDRQVPEDLREQFINYRVTIRVLGVVRAVGDDWKFVASHRRLPHVGSKVGFPSIQVLRKIAGHHDNGADIGRLAFGEYVYDLRERQHEDSDLQMLDAKVCVKFPVKALVSRRSFVFARAGFGKSNLNKLLFSELYRETPTHKKGDGKLAPVGTVIFDPDGEYFWPDSDGRPGLCDVPHLENKLVVFTGRSGPSPFYQSFVAGGVRLDIRRLRPSDVIAIALDKERQQQQNVRKLRSLSQDDWTELVNLIDKDKNNLALKEVSRLLNLKEGNQDVEATAARSNMTAIVNMLHDKSSLLLDKLMHALAEGKICVIDISLMRGSQSLVLSGLILRRIFDHNQEEFTKKDPKTIPVIAVLEEAQSVLNEKSTSSEPYIAWVKEGRKYNLGAVMITQQPGSIPTELLSQGDNWFAFHLLAAADLYALKKANGHFSDDILSSLLNEPIPGHGVLWSSVHKKSYPISMRVLDFSDRFQRRDTHMNKPEGNTYVVKKRQNFKELGGGADVPATDMGTSENAGHEIDETRIDAKAAIEEPLIELLQKDDYFVSKLESEEGVALGSVRAFFKENAPEGLDNVEEFAYNLVKPALNTIWGKSQWEIYFRKDKHTSYAKRKKR